MKRLIRWLVILGILGGIGWWITGPLAQSIRERNKVQWREAEVTRGRIVAVVNSTGTVKPVRLVQVGTFVSGPIESIPKNVDFNAEIKKGELLAIIDARTYKANVAREEAALATRKAEVTQTAAKLQQAKNDENRANALRAQNKGFISESEIDQFKFNRMALEALLDVTSAAVDQAQANLDLAKANLEYTEIRMPVDGFIIDRKVDPGQTVAASFQTPDLFIVAPDMRKEMHVYASVDEA